MTKTTKTPAVEPVVERCTHPIKRRCNLCGEGYCPNDTCDPYHVQGCWDAAKP